ncbi:ATP-binding protein [Nocardia sp. N2S4-5]|uniref:ATP-binding protein n=1 Tax=Nocardia sp. N2S4-5 TaxID=3351565 RepID=UPI0037D34F0F
MNDEQRRALSAIQFSSALGTDAIWSPLAYHVDGLHPHAVAAIKRAVAAADSRPRSQPAGLVLSGERGVGKTHLLGWLRHFVQQQGGFFFMPKLIVGESFWSGAVHGVVNQMSGADGGQLGRMIDALSQHTGCGKELRIRLRGNIQVSKNNLDEFIERIGQFDSHPMRDYEDTLRALVLYQANSRDLRDVGHAFLLLEEGIEESDKTAWGFRGRRRAAQQIFNDLSWLFALSGPVVLAIDQVDTVITQSRRDDEVHLADVLAAGLMDLREETVRTIIVAACIPKSWELIAQHAVNSASDRFTVLELSTNMPSSDVARTIVERHLASQYDEIGFDPPYPSWPVMIDAFADPDIAHYTPRRLLKQVEDHVRRCLDLDAISELSSFVRAVEDSGILPLPSAKDLGAFDAEFARLRVTADTNGPLDSRHEDDRMFAVLNAALHCYVLEQRENGRDLTLDPRTRVQPALHARLRCTLDEANEDEEHWSFRAIGHTNARAVLTRLRSACLEADIQPNLSKRHLVVVRNIPFSPGPVTKQTLTEFEAAGGLALPICEDDLRTFSALERMLATARAGFSGWLLARRPAGRSQLFTRAAIGSAAADEPQREMPVARPDTDSVLGAESVMNEGAQLDRSARTRSVPADSDALSLNLGRSVDGGRELRIPLNLLRKHTAVFAGSGSGKTVLLRRLVEEVALQGVSSILIDSNNDLARMGDRWPHRPESWGSGDAERAEEYFESVDVVVWTPGRESGQPIALNPLPDFAEVGDDPDELRTTVAAAVAGLAPKTGLSRAQAGRGQAVLTEALAHFAGQGGGQLEDFVALLANLPQGVSAIRRAADLAAGMADELRAAMITDPVFRGAGNRLDPGTLLTPTPGRRARVSVISCVGLADGQPETFVNQLQLALFAWIKQHPAGDRPLGALLVLDEAQTFVPAQQPAASKQSTLRLATQARKYGLGMVYATQAPKALHNLVSGNAATQFYGRLGAAVQIRVAEELARALRFTPDGGQGLTDFQAAAVRSERS